MTFLRVFAFSVLSLLVFTAVANVLPQVQSDPPKEEKIDTAALDMAGMISLGERLFRGKGTCTLCHNELGRAPDLLQINLAEEFPRHFGDPDYSGVAKDATGPQAFEGYIRESMQDPSAYVVSGFGKKGTNDTVSPMPKVDAAPIELKPVEMNAVIAFLQDRAGVAPSVPLPAADNAAAAAAADTSSADSADTAEEDGPMTDASEAIDEFGCSACHDLNDSEGDLGPDLRGVGDRLTRAEIMESIYDPNARITEGFEADLMPQDFGDQMRVSELNLIVDYLIGWK